MSQASSADQQRARCHHLHQLGLQGSKQDSRMRSAWKAQAAASSAQLAAEPGAQPKKRLYRSRAHSNPLNDQHFPVPAHPDACNWCAACRIGDMLSWQLCSRVQLRRAQHYPAHWPAADVARPSPAVTIADVGCGFGGLLVQLATTFPDQLALGMEIRDKVTPGACRFTVHAVLSTWSWEGRVLPATSLQSWRSVKQLSGSM